MIEFNWNPEVLLFIIAVAWSALGFACYYFLARNKSLSHKIRSSFSKLDMQAKEVVIQRLWGFIFMGLIPVIFLSLLPGEKLMNYGLGFSFWSLPPWWLMGVLAFIIITGAFAAARPGNLALYPQIRIKQWTPGMLTLSGITWIVFLLAYEFLFRGFLLFAAVAIMDVWAAIALNCALYAFAHFYKGPGETFGTIPIGILLCYLTLRTGNIWTALLIHSVMALSNEWWSIRANKEMKVVKSVKSVKS